MFHWDDATILDIADPLINGGERFFILIVEDRSWIVQVELHVSHTFMVAR